MTTLLITSYAAVAIVVATVFITIVKLADKILPELGVDSSSTQIVITGFIVGVLWPIVLIYYLLTKLFKK